MFHQVSMAWEHGSSETNMGDVWEPPPKSREIHGGWGDVRVPVSKIIKIKIKLIKSQQ